MSTVTVPTTTDRPAAPCVRCGTIGGSQRGSGQHVRYRGERYGLAGMLCATCRAREKRHQHARTLGFEPGKVGRRPKRTAEPRESCRQRAGQASSDSDGDHSRARLSPEHVAETLRTIREERERAGSRPRAGESPSDLQRRRWAELAEAERKRVVATRRQAMARGWPSELPSHVQSERREP